MSVSLQKNKNVKQGNLQQRLHWYIIMIVLTIGLLVVLGKGIQSFIQIGYGQDTVVDTDSDSATVFDLQELETTINYFDTLGSKHADLLATPPEVTDPS